MAARAVAARLLDGARFQAPRVVDKVFGVFAELAAQHLGVDGANPRKVVRAVLGQAAGDARPDAPDVGDRAVEPDLALERLVVKLADAVAGVLRANVERHLRLEHVRSDAGRGGDIRNLEGAPHQAFCERARVGAVEAQVGRGIDEALVDGIRLQVLWADKLKVAAHDFAADLHVSFHARDGGQVLDARWDVAHATAVAHAGGLHGRRDGKADGVCGTVGVGHHQVGGERVKAAIGAFHAGVERLQVDAYNATRGFAQIRHPPILSVSPSFVR